MTLLRHGLLEGRVIAAAPAGGGVICARLCELGATVVVLPEERELGEDEERVGEWARARAPLHALIYDAGALPSTEVVWAAVREVAVGALIPGEGVGKVILVGPKLAAGSGAPALRAALENLARTLSVEWARFGVSTVMLAPGSECGEDAVAELAAFLCSPGGEYFSGCRLELT